jgi:hypothetical protein
LNAPTIFNQIGAIANARRIACDGSGNPWVVDADGHILKYENDVWTVIADGGCIASDIGISSLDDVWIVDCYSNVK